MKPDTNLEALLDKANLMSELTDEQIAEIEEQVYDGFLADVQSRMEWEKQVKDWTKLAMQVVENKSFPWQNAANVKYPLLSTAAIQFSARAYPSLVPGNGQIVGARIMGFDPKGKKTLISKLVTKDMSSQILFQMDDWEDQMDQLLITEAIVGCAFKKTYWDVQDEKVCSDFVHPLDLYVDYYTTSLAKAERITQVYTMTENTVKEYENAELFDCGDDENRLGAPKELENIGTRQLVYRTNSSDGGDSAALPYLILEQHGYYDLDEDGYKEPYIFFLEYGNKKLLRMVSRWDSKSVKTNAKGEVIRIKPIQQFTKFSFIKSPDGGFYDVGFGLLLGSLNKTADTLINQMLDAGTLRNLQAGFIGKGLRLGNNGRMALGPGEWKEVNVTGQTIKDNIFPLPLGEPSEVLFKLLGMIIESGNKLASVAEIFVGKMPGQNTPATTTMETVEQGMKLFTAIYKRNFRALDAEFKKIFRLNEIYRTDEEIMNMLDLPQEAVEAMDGKVKEFMYNYKGYDICPGADANIATQSQRAQKNAKLIQMVPLGVNKEEALRRLLTSEEYENIPALLAKPEQEPPPPPEVMKLKMEDEHFQAEMEFKKSQQLTVDVLNLAKAVAAKAQAKAAAMPEGPEAPEDTSGEDLDRLLQQLEKLEERQKTAEDREHDLKKLQLQEATKKYGIDKNAALKASEIAANMAKADKDRAAAKEKESKAAK